ncbi:hypothetical protein L9G15_23600, partial [Shewanella sp. A3A]|nr:hypothetical protein [Shewanella ferrihydritica]
MNQKVKTYLPAVIVVLIAAALLIYQATTGKQMPDDLKQKMQDAANNGQKLTIEQMKEMRGKGEGGGWKDW